MLVDAVLVAASVAAVAALAVSVGAPIAGRDPAASAARSPVPPPIAFVSSRDGVEGVYVVDPDGTHLRRLIPNARDPRWSPDGSHIAFRRGDDDALYVADARGRNVRRLVGTADGYTWAPDGTRLAIAGAPRGIVVVGLDGSRTRLTERPDAAPSWSPDGKLIAFVRGTGETGALVVMSSKGGQERPLASGVNAPQPAWSPDGRRIAFVRALRPVVADVATAAQRALLARRLDEWGIDDATLAWSPDGSRIAVGEPGTVTLVRLEGGRRTVYEDAWSRPSWSPDGRAVAFDDDDASADVVVASLAGAARPITEARRYGYANTVPDWYPRTVGAAVGGTPVSPSIPTDSRQIGLVLHTRSTVDFVAADGPRVALAYRSGWSCIELWTPSTRRLVRFAEGACSATSRGAEAQGIAGLALAGSRVAWTTWMETNHYATTVASATPLRPAPVSVFSVEDVESAGAPIGDGQLLVFESWRDDRRGVLRRIDGRRVSRVAATTAAPSLLAVGGGLIVRRHDATAVDVLRGDGSLAGTFRASGKVRGGAVDDGVVAIATAGRLSAYDVRAPSRVTSREIGARERLVDLDGGVAVLVDRHSIRLLRLADGAAVRIHVPGAGRVATQLEPSGLFYSYAAEGPDGGRVVFVPRAGLDRRLGRG